MLPKKAFLAGGFSGARSQGEGRPEHTELLVVCAGFEEPNGAKGRRDVLRARNPGVQDAAPALAT